MASKKIVTLVCDICQSDDMVETHILTVDGVTKEAEACWACWNRALTPLLPFSKVGRDVQPPKPVKVKKADIVPFPGQSWKFTSHALIRLGERHLDPTQAAFAAEKPEINHPGRTPDTEVHVRGPIKVVIQPAKRLILTAARRDEIDDEVA